MKAQDELKIGIQLAYKVKSVCILLACVSTSIEDKHTHSVLLETVEELKDHLLAMKGKYITHQEVYELENEHLKEYTRLLLAHFEKPLDKSQTSA